MSSMSAARRTITNLSESVQLAELNRQLALLWTRTQNAATKDDLADGIDGIDTTHAIYVEATVSLPVASWSSNQQTASVTGLLADDLVEVGPAPASWEAYNNCGVRATAQAAGSLTFTCSETPTAALSVNVVMWRIVT